MNRPPHGTPNGEDGFIWGVGITVVVIVAVWWKFHAQISACVMWLRWAEAHLLWFDPEGRAMLVEWLRSVAAQDVTLAQLRQSGEVAGYQLRWPAMLILGGIFGWIIYRHPGRDARYKRKYTLMELARAEARSFPTITPVLDLDLTQVSLDDRVNGMRQNARDYCTRRGLIIARHTPEKQIPEDAIALDEGDFLLREKCLSTLRRQLGRPWSGVEELKAFERTLLATFVALFMHQQAVAESILNQMALQWAVAIKENDPTKLTVPLVGEVIESYLSASALRADTREARKLQSIFNRHFHVRCVLARLLQEARKNGALPPGTFRWVKMVDRTTWYTLNDVGLDVASAESAAVRAHYLAERAAKSALEVPMVEAALAGFVEYLNSFSAAPDFETELDQ